MILVQYWHWICLLQPRGHFQCAVFICFGIMSNILLLLICVRYIISSGLVTHVVGWTIFFLVQQSAFFILASLSFAKGFGSRIDWDSSGTKVLAYHIRMNSSFKSFVLLSPTSSSLLLKKIYIKRRFSVGSYFRNRYSTHFLIAKLRFQRRKRKKRMWKM